MRDCASDLIAGLVMGAVAAGLFIWGATSHHYETEAIKNNCAAYDTKTGQWQWIEKEGDTE